MSFRLASALVVASAACGGSRAEWPDSVTPAAIAEGRAIFAAHCARCHGADGVGTRLAPRLSDPHRLWLPTGQLAEVRQVIERGVPVPREFGAPMPPLGGADLRPADVEAVAAYVWSIGRVDPR